MKSYQRLSEVRAMVARERRAKIKRAGAHAPDPVEVGRKLPERWLSWDDKALDAWMDAHGGYDGDVPDAPVG